MLLPVIAACTRRVGARVLVALACAALPLSAGCGKKGPPLAPLARLPVAPGQVSASRAGDTVTIGFTVPGANVSGVRPADIDRVDVYAWTGPEVPAALVFKVGKVVASVPVRPPPPSREADDDGTVPPPPPPVGSGVDQGAVTHLRETLAADAFTPVDVPAAKKARTVREPRVTPPDAMPVPPPLARRYVVVGVNGSRRGAPSGAMAVPLWTPPPAPPGVAAKPIEAGTELTWTAPAPLRRPVMANALPDRVRAPAASRPAARQPAAVQRLPDDDDDDDQVPDDTPPRPPPNGGRPEGGARPPAAAPGESPQDVTERAPEARGERPATDGTGLLPARLAMPWPPVTVGYHVYDVGTANAPPVVSAQAGGPAPTLPRRLTSTPLQVTTFSDTRVEYGVERCYVVRTVETVGALTLESAGSDPACVKATDVFPPAAPRSLAAVASDGAISLIWEGSDEADLAGYIVLRSVAPRTPGERLTPQPIRETTFRDTTVKPGTRYIYAVVAVDTARPPNASAPSNQVEETAR